MLQLRIEAGEVGELEDEPPCDSSSHREQEKPNSSNLRRRTLPMLKRKLKTWLHSRHFLVYFDFYIVSFRFSKLKNPIKFLFIHGVCEFDGTHIVEI